MKLTLSCPFQSLPCFQAPSPRCVLTLMTNPERSVFFFRLFKKMYNKTIISTVKVSLRLTIRICQYLRLFLRLNFLAALRLTVIPIEILFLVQKL